MKQENAVHSPPRSTRHGLSAALLVGLVLAAIPAQAVEMAWSFVAGTPTALDCDPQPQGCFGGVVEPFLIGRFEVTNGQYTEFLNAVAAADANAVYDTAMAGSFGGIDRFGSSPNFTYAAQAGREDKPASSVSFYSALRFANWLHNGQPTGAQDATTTEDGAYPFSGPTTVGPRSAGALVFLPDENQWYQAAYYSPSTGTYHDFPASSNLETICATPTLQSNSANCNNVSGDTVDVGSYPTAQSPNRTFDQGGNVWEWNETVIGAKRGRRGAARASAATSLGAAVRDSVDPTVVNSSTGFRVARTATPVQGTFGLSALARVGDVAPGTGGATYAAFGRTSSNASGDVAFQALLSSGDSGIFRISAGVTTNVALESDPIALGPPTINSSGDIAFRLGSTAELTDPRSILVDSEGSQVVVVGPELVLVTSGPFPIDDQGNVLFHAADATVQGGLFTGAGGVLTPILQYGDPLPGGGAFAADSLLFNGGFALSPSGEAAFQTFSFTNPAFRLLRSTAGTASLATADGDPAPGTGGGVQSLSLAHVLAFGNALRPGALNSAGDLVFSSPVSGGVANAGVFRETGGALEAVAVEGEAFQDGGVIILALGDAAIDDGGVVYFDASTSGGEAILANMNGTLTAVVADGDAVPGVPGATFSDVFYASPSFAGAVTFTGVYGGGGGGEGVFLAGSLPCADLLDNDGDGLVDLADPGCTSATDPSERDPALACDDGEDNDGDGRVDFDPTTRANPGNSNTPPSGTGDPGCASPTWFSESPQCQNGVDDADGEDALADYDGGFSVTGIPGLAADPQCVGQPWKGTEKAPGKRCGLGAELAVALPCLWALRRRRKGAA